VSSEAEAATRMASRYKQLILNFINQEIPAAEFEKSYLSLFKSDRSKVGGEKFNILDKLFADIDAFVDDPELRERVYGGIGADELLVCAREAYQKLYQT
jgi:hypothetical protein